MSLIRGVLLAGKFRTHHELNGMSHEDQRNTLIVELSGRTNQSIPHFQSLDDATLAGTGAVLVYLRDARIRTEAELTTISDDDQRNILIVELGSQTSLPGGALQGMSNMDLVLLGLGKEAQPGVVLTSGRISFIRGVLLAGKFRTQHDLNNMSAEDQRNTLIVEMAGHSNQSISSYQALNDATLAGVGAVMVFLREAKLRDDAALKTMSADDQRNTLIVELDGQTHFGSRLQALSNMDLVLLGLGADVFVPNEVHGISRTGDGVFGESNTGVGVHGKGRRLAGFFEGDVEVTGDIRLTNADCAEDFDVSGVLKQEPGTVMVLGNEGALSESQQAYDKRVAGVISGAGDYKPGIVLDKRQTHGNRQPIALMGKVFCKVDAQFGAIEVGDLLTTSPTPGHAMKTSDPLNAFGAVIGKALRPWTSGCGLIPILIALQ
jgi:hypothetical protein